MGLSMTILKLAFAMGGGVSLGTFNAGALAQTIKLAILYGKDKQGDHFDKVEIDVFSGASAGAISLALMVRALAAQSESQIATATKSLKKEFSQDFTNLNDDKKDALIAAQVMFDVQRKIWVDDVCMEKLLAPVSTKVGDPDALKYSAGILNRAALERIAIDLIKNSPTANLNETKKLLSNRVLFASSLSNLTPTIQDAKGEFSVRKGGEYALGDGMTSYTHGESRIFDLYFDETADLNFAKTDIHPSRWIRYHLGARKKGVIGDMTQGNNAVWWNLVSTAMASGAFPMAFEPVVLQRYRFEFGNTWPKELVDHDSFNFTYIDGGVYNNEPIRDAFKLASFIDANEQRDNTERAVIFVDPSVTDNVTEFHVPVQQRFKLCSPLLGNNWLGDIDGIDLEVKTSLQRLSSHAITILNGICNQARSLEGDKIFQVRKRFEQRNGIRNAFVNETSVNVSHVLLFALYKQITTTQMSDLEQDLMPSAALKINAEVRRIIREEAQMFKDFNEHKIDSDLVKIGSNETPELNTTLWYLMLRFVLLDQTMGLSGKSDNVRFFAIGPFAKPDADKYAEAQRITLPGDKYMAFGGFMFKGAREVDMRCGQYCALRALTTQDFLSISSGDELVPALNTLTGEDKEYEKALNKGIEALIDRVLDMLTDSLLPKILRGPLKYAFKKFLESDGVAADIELRIKLPSNLKLELDGRGRVIGIGDKDIQRIKLPDGYYLITFGHINGENQWQGEHINHSQSITLDKRNRSYADIPTPDPELVKKMKLYGYAYLQYDFTSKKVGNNWTIETSVIPMHKILMNKANG